MAVLERLLEFGVTPLLTQHHGDVVDQEVVERLPVLGVVEPRADRDEFVSGMIYRDGKSHVPEPPNPVLLLQVMADEGFTHLLRQLAERRLSDERQRGKWGETA